MRESESDDYLLPADVSLARLETWVRGQGRLAPSSTESTRRIHYDTFDWAVHGDGAMLACQGRGPRWHLIRLPLDPRERQLVLELDAPPDFPAHLPAGALRERLLGCCGVRRLLPLIQLDTQAEIHRVLGDDDHTLLRFAIERTRYRDPNGAAAGALAPRLRVLPGQGARRQRERLIDGLERTLELRPARVSVVVEALAAIGRYPGDYSSKLDLDIAPETRAEEAARAVLRELLGTLEANVEGAREAIDPEFLHDLRVATRRTRSALGQFGAIFPETRLRPFREGFAWLQRVTGPVRDLDVQLEQFALQRAGLPEALRGALDPLRERLHADHVAAQRALADELGGETCARLLADWHDFLDTPLAPEALGPAARRPVRTVVDARLRRLARQVLREGAAIGADSPPEALHALRKRCKKLRYMMEFFHSLYPRREIRKSIRQTKDLLDNLGGFQDRAVQAERLRLLARRMFEAGEADSDTLLAIGALVGQLLAQQRDDRAAFDEVFGAFRAKSSRARLKALFGG
ncbi:CHAD domain-containing protein [Marichromatium gracile]|uniref:CYTH and CHAD domain-containing protein n=1 Tax=Marichromatium gracile TaxID=1048 RepID=UPI001F3746D4|nr:CHAD domain-containing protein [Marichromatium gracile]MCF1182183.1 CHAD domain-containing protein [Marichromatium gracile]